MGDAGHPGGGDTKNGDEAPEEDGLSSVLGKEPLCPGQDLVGMSRNERPALEQRATALAPDPVADVVPDDRRRRGDRDHLDDVQLVLRGEDAAGNERSLAGKRNPGGLDADEHEQQDESPRLVVLDQVRHGVSLGMARPAQFVGW